GPETTALSIFSVAKHQPPLGKWILKDIVCGAKPVLQRYEGAAEHVRLVFLEGQEGVHDAEIRRAVHDLAVEGGLRGAHELLRRAALHAREPAPDARSAYLGHGLLIRAGLEDAV